MEASVAVDGADDDGGGGGGGWEFVLTMMMFGLRELVTVQCKAEEN